MSEPGDVELYNQAVSLLRPGEAELVGIVVHTGFDRTEEPEMSELMLAIGEEIATHVRGEEMYVYAGEADDRFGAGQFHGLGLEDDAFIWECQQLLREGTFDLVFYWERAGAQDAVVEAATAHADAVVPITEDGFPRPE
ncbi:MAG: DUF5778 family protein [Halodesulfurarchaeum sp.]